nr:reverse transcriptase domain-containing protein [Tanacetum cinerariifolium]
MTKVIKGEFEKLEDLNDKDVSLACDTSLEVFSNEFNRMSEMDDDLFTYEVEVSNIPCDSNKDDDSEQRVLHESDDDMGYNPSDIAFTEWLGSKKINYKTLDHYIKKEIWIYWIRGNDEVKLTDEEFSDNEDEVAKVFRIDTIYFILRYICARPLNNLTIFCKSVQTYLLKTLRDSRLMKNIRMIGSMNGTKIYHGLMRNYGLTLNWKNDRYCNRGNLPRAYIVGNSLHYQDYDWYKALMDCELKEQALRNKPIMEGLISNDESCNNGWRRCEAWDRFKDLLRACLHHGFSKLHQLDTFYNALNSKDQDSLNSATGGNFLDKMPRECLAIIESKSKVCYSRNKPVVAKVSTNTSTSVISPDVAEIKDMVKALLLDKKGQNQSPALVKVVKESCVTCGGAHSYRNCPATDGNVYRDNIQEFVSQASAVNYNQGNTSYRPPMMSNQIRPHAYQAPAPQTKGVSKDDFSAYVKANDVVMRNMQTQAPPSFLPKVVEDEPDVTKNTVNPTNNESTEDVQPQVVQSESPISISEPVTSLISEPVITPVSAPKPNPKSSIPYPSRRNDERNLEKANNQIEKFYQIFKDMSFEISFANALIPMPKFSLTLKALIANKEKLSEMARTLLNEHCYAVLLKKLPKKTGRPRKVSDSILSLLDLTPRCMTLELGDRLISHPVRVAEDVYVKVGSFYYSADFVVVDFDADPRVPLILGRSFLKTEKSLIDVFEGELTLRVSKEAITFNLDQTSRYSTNYSDMTAKRIDIIDMACEEYSQEVLGFFDIMSSGNPTPYYDLIVSTTSLTLTPFRNSDFFLKEVGAFLAIEDDPTSPEVYQPYLDPEGDILLLQAFLNDDPSLPPPNQGNYLPGVRKELKIYEAKSDKSSIDEPPKVELKDLPPHLEYAFLEGDDKLPVIIVKDLSVEEKTALITILKSYKRAIAWKLSHIKGIDPEFCTHKILMEKDSEPPRRVNLKIHDVIKQEVIKLLEAGLIYPISDSPWVSPVHCVPKKGGFTVVENEDNELILTSLVMGWRVCIDYRKLNEATERTIFLYCLWIKYQEITTFTCPYGTFSYRRMPFGLCNAPGTFQRCMMATFYDLIKKTIEVFMDDFSVFGNFFQSCLSHLERMLKRCEGTNLCLNWEKSHFMVKEGIVLGHKISKKWIEFDKAKVDVLTKIPPPTIVKGIRSFLGHACFYRRTTPMAKLLASHMRSKGISRSGAIEIGASVSF